MSVFVLETWMTDCATVRLCDCVTVAPAVDGDLGPVLLIGSGPPFASRLITSRPLSHTHISTQTTLVPPSSHHSSCCLP